jgi:hypothetical protein
MILLAFFLLIAGKTLFLSPVHGIADNRDFWRVMVPAGIVYEKRPSDTLYRYVERKFVLVSVKLQESTTSAVLPAWLARSLVLPFTRNFDLRLLGALYLLAFASGIFFLLRQLGGAGFWLLGPGLLWLSLEPSLLLHFNSFFSVLPHLALWPWLLVILLRMLEQQGRGEDSLRPALLLALLALFLATSKLQFVLLPLLLLLALLIGRRRLHFRSDFFLYGAFLAALLFTFGYSPSQRRGVEEMSRYQTVFGGIAIAARDSSRPLAALGVPPEFHSWAGRNLPEELMRNELPPDLKASLAKVSRLQILGLYLTEPGALGEAIERIQESLTRWPLGYLGNFEQSTARAGEELRFPWQFSRLRDPVLQALPWLVWLIPFAALLMVPLLLKWGAGPAAGLLAFLLLHFCTQLPVVVLGDGFYALHRHLIVGRLLWDLLLWLLLALAVGAAANCVAGRCRATFAARARR